VSSTIPREEADRAERFECYCGRHLEVAPAVICSGCRLRPDDCRCEELPEPEQV
jgi:hypothetical protein